jgi:hypothetical protein
MMVEISGARTHRVRCWWNVLIAGVCLTFSHALLAHGSVVEDGDLCLIKIGFYQAHFTIFQPQSEGHEEYCEDLPDTGETVFVIDYLHDSMREVPVDFRIVHDRNGVGRFARYEDVLKLDLEKDSVFYQPPLMQADAVFTVLHPFAEAGAYIGVVTAEHPTEDTVYRAVFPFEVARFPWEYVVWLGVVGGLVAVLLWLRFVHFGAPVRRRPV